MKGPNNMNTDTQHTDINPTKTTEKNTEIMKNKGNPIPQIVATVILLLAFAGVSLLLLKTKHELQTKSNVLTVQLQAALQEKEDIIKAHKEELETIRGIGYDQGYQSAIWDVFLGTPQYLVQENQNEISFWKRQNIDDETKVRIKSINPSAFPEVIKEEVQNIVDMPDKK